MLKFFDAAIFISDILLKIITSKLILKNLNSKIWVITGSIDKLPLSLAFLFLQFRLYSKCLALVSEKSFRLMMIS